MTEAQIALFQYIPAGAIVTLEYTLLAVIISLVLGTLLAICKLSHNTLLYLIAQIYTSIFRGTPLLVQLFLVYFALPGLTGINLSVFVSGVIAFSLNSAAYVSEIIRAGIKSIDKGQFEAAQSLGVSYFRMMKDIILPQSIINILPALVNEIVNVLKESALISTIGGADLMRRAQIVAAEQYSFFQPYLIAAASYYLLVMLFSLLAKMLERRLKIA